MSPVFLLYRIKVSVDFGTQDPLPTEEEKHGKSKW